MLRWYDFIAVGIMANVMSGVFWATVATESMWTSFFGGVALVLLHDVWVVYCTVRKVSEDLPK